MKKITQNQLLPATLHFCARLSIKFLAVGCLFISAFIFNGCRSAATIQQHETSIRKITDDLGREVKIPEKIERAVSLAPNLTEIVFAVGAGERLVGRTSYDNFPPEATTIPTIGDTMNPNIENIIALKPQVVLVSTASQIQTFTNTLDQQNIAYFITNPGDLEGIYKSIQQIGEIFGNGEKAREVVEKLQKRVSEVEAKTKNMEKPKVFLQISREPLYTIGADSFLTDLIERAGGVSVTKNVPTAYPKLSKETALALDPDIIVLSESADNFAPNNAFKDSKAVKNGKVFKINADIISRPAPRIVDALEQITRDLHPESFK